MDTQTAAWEEFLQALELAGAHLRVWRPEGIASQSVSAPTPRNFVQALYCTFGRARSDCCYHPQRTIMAHKDSMLDRLLYPDAAYRQLQYCVDRHPRYH